MICEICGKEFESSVYSNPYDKVCSSKCFNHKFWDLIVKEKESHLIINGTCYLYEFSPSSVKGFGGRSFDIEKFDGTVIHTNNLWCQGRVPSTHRELLKDNARFIQ